MDEGNAPDNRPTAGKNGRAANGQFMPGTSGNPGGRPRTKFTESLRQVLEKADDAGTTRRERLAIKLVEMAEGGDLAALRYVVDRLDGRPAEATKGSTVSIDLPPLDSLPACAEAGRIVMKALLAGSIDTAAAETMRKAIETAGRAIELVQLEPRLKALEDERRWASRRLG